MILVPLVKFLGVFSFKEYSAKPGDSFHATAPLGLNLLPVSHVLEPNSMAGGGRLGVAQTCFLGLRLVVKRQADAADLEKRVCATGFWIAA
jgi:hypothetical protein